MFRVVMISLMFVLGCSSSVMAASDLDKVRATVQKLVPGIEPDSIQASPLEGMYEVVIGLDVVYISADGRYLLNGNLMDLETDKNLTEDKRAAGRLKLIAAVDESKMIIYSPEKVKHTITVFTDIDCPYCRRMHQEMDQLNSKGIEVRYMFFPRAGKDSKSYKKAVAVWCAEDRRQALTDAKAGKQVAQQVCENPVDEHMALVQELGITGTPTSILENGQVLPGYIPAAKLAEALDAGAGS